MVSDDDSWLDDYEEGATNEEVLDRLKRGALLWNNDATPEEIAQAVTERFGPAAAGEMAGMPDGDAVEESSGVHPGASRNLPPFDATGEPVGPNAAAWKKAVGWSNGRAGCAPSATHAWSTEEEFPAQRVDESREEYLKRLARTAPDWIYDTPTVPPASDDASGD